MSRQTLYSELGNLLSDVKQFLEDQIVATGSVSDREQAAETKLRQFEARLTAAWDRYNSLEPNHQVNQAVIARFGRGSLARRPSFQRYHLAESGHHVLLTRALKEIERLLGEAIDEIHRPRVVQDTIAIGKELGDAGERLTTLIQQNADGIVKPLHNQPAPLAGVMALLAVFLLKMHRRFCSRPVSSGS